MTGGPEEFMSPVRQAKVRAAVNEHAEKMIQEKFRETQTASDQELERLPQFSMAEIVKGKFLGKGFFGMVYEIKGFNVNDDTMDNDAGVRRSEGKHDVEEMGKDGGQNRRGLPRQGNGRRWKFVMPRNARPSTFNHDFDVVPLPHEQVMMTTITSSSSKDDGDGGADGTKKEDIPADRREFMKRHCLRENRQARYAIKQLRPEILKDPTKLYYQGIMDLNSEARLLSSVQHPHIVKIRAIAKGESTFHEQYFIVLDRLYQVLEDRLKDWQRSQKRICGFAGRQLWDRSGKKRANLWEERIVAAYDLASAMAYLHSKRIVHRDLKNDNVGFDIRGDIKMFDFGLARELPRQEEADEDGAWKMTGDTGTPRMMANEVALGQPYNASCDTYSFCLLLWEILALKTPFELYTQKLFSTKVWRPPYKRPVVDPAWPKSIHLLLQRGWSGNPKERHSMTNVAEILRKEVVACRNGNDDGLDHLERRSTHVFEEDEIRSHHNFMSLLSSPFTKKSPFRLSSKKNPSLDGTQQTVNSLTPSRMDLSGTPVVGAQCTTSFPRMPPLFCDDGDIEIKSPITIPSTEGILEMTTSEDWTADDDNFPTDEEDSCEARPHCKDEDHNPADSSLDNNSWHSSHQFVDNQEESLWDRLSEEKARRERIRSRILEFHEKIRTANPAA